MPDLSNIHYKFFPKAKTASTGKKLYYFAWAIEILVCIVALSISVIMLLSGGQTGTQVEELASNFNTDTVLLSFAFVVVAVMELTKIPLATAFYYSARLNWRIVFFIALLVVNFSTFETMLTAFEMNYAKRSEVVDKVRTEIEDIAEKIDANRQNRDDTKLVAKLREIDSELSLKEKELEIFSTNHEVMKITKSKIASDAILLTEQSLAKQISEINKLAESDSPQIENDQKTIERLGKENESSEKKIIRLERDKKNIQNNFFSQNDERDRAIIDSKISKILGKIKKNEDIIIVLTAKQDDAIGQTGETKKRDIQSARNLAQKKIEKKESDLKAEIATINSVYNSKFETKNKEIEKLRESKDPYIAQQKKLDNNEEQRQSTLEELINLNAEKKDELKIKAKQNQVYRLAEKINVIAHWFSGGDIDPRVIANNEKIEELIFKNRNLKIENESINRKLDAEDGILFKKTEEDKLEFQNLISKNTNMLVDNDNEIALLQSDNKRILEKSELTDGIISQGELDFAFWIWFGSLSFVISIIGTLVAFAGLHLQDERTHKILNKPLSSSKMFRHFKLTPIYINKAFKALKKRLLQPVKVTVYEEIEVEKIVERIVEKPYEVEKIVEKPIEHIKVEFQRIEIPKEVIRKEIVYVPFPTNDKGILDKGPYKVKNNKKEYTEEEE